MKDENDDRVPGAESEERQPSSSSDPAKGQRHGRRQFLKAVFLAAGAAGAAAYVKPTFAMASAGSDISNDLPIPLPFHHEGLLPGGSFRAVVGGLSLYEFTGSVLIDIDVDGNVLTRGALLVGTHLSGPNRGTVRIAQSDGAAIGRYDGTLLSVPDTPGTFSTDEEDGTGNLLVLVSAFGLLGANRVSFTIDVKGPETVTGTVTKTKNIG